MPHVERKPLKLSSREREDRANGCSRSPEQDHCSCVPTNQFLDRLYAFVLIFAKLGVSSRAAMAATARTLVAYLSRRQIWKMGHFRAGLIQL